MWKSYHWDFINSDVPALGQMHFSLFYVYIHKKNVYIHKIKYIKKIYIFKKYIF